ncbi:MULTISPECIES: phosphoadenosine phosphosulfate reductase family protein [unclassified Pseudomonas]|uniref:phosphoadenosine phosphosulfate reductase domain-containing protein n=1 Tax=unclassified Pseudomonas TaxID=196821 RepID=UPI00244B3FE8|nr:MULTISPECIES: phosphoadenosine phosphosulfate reductase family protein [unclassified Pseudomonas]MDG9929651.1 phosphoadenosine phosphosulfate reductase family protein [Pseudomonas sp. GD04042]MDH0483426.1 phosphoadenosine phosphosulfate reductase family protein [Pseudomonas sp. GD04015]MDH0604771.1 phosphoadenosine phosphosulfate reductase family protein [Pseudomonas sp. GD03869]
MTFDLATINAELGKDAEKLVEWALGLGKTAICTTNFRPFEAVILHMVTRVKPDTQVIWMDNGYNTEATYRFADEVTKLLDLNLKTYLPLRSRAHREAVDGPVPALDDPRHAAFTEEVKLEPFARALREAAPQVWFTALRASDTAVRAQMDPVSINPDGLIKVAPLLHWSSKELYQYLVQHNLPNNFDYFDPTKGEENRECGLHLSH